MAVSAEADISIYNYYEPLKHNCQGKIIFWEKIMAKKYEDDELEKLIDESFTEEELMEEGLLSEEEDDFGPYDPSEEEIRASYQELVARLKREGVYREETEKTISMEKVSEKRKRKRFYGRKLAKVAGMVLVCSACVFAASMTSEANRNYFVNNFKYLVGDDTRVVIGNDEENEDILEDEYAAIADIEEKLGVHMPEFLYRPLGFEYYKYEVDSYAQVAKVEYLYEKNIITLFMSRNNNITSSLIESLHGNIIKTIILNDENVEVTVKKIQEEGDLLPSYAAEWKKDGIVYLFSGKMEFDKFKKIIEDIWI